MTYSKIAKIAGVSVSTVSKVLSGSTEISEKTAARIRKIAEENAVVRPKYHSDRPVTRIAVIVPEIVSVNYSQTVSALVDEFRSYGIEPNIYLCGFETDRFCRIMKLISDESMTDGIIAVTGVPYLYETEIPIVRLAAYNPDCKFTIDSDLETGIYVALTHLYELGHRRIGFIGEENTPLKLKYFISGMNRLGLKTDDSLMFISHKRFEAIGMEAAEYYLSLPKPPSALLAAYDEVALGAIHTFTGHGVRIPDDISIIGINDIPSASYASVPLTTIRTFANEIIRLCVKSLLDCIEMPGQPRIPLPRIQCELIIRETTAPYRQENTGNISHKSLKYDEDEKEEKVKKQ